MNSPQMFPVVWREIPKPLLRPHYQRALANHGCSIHRIAGLRPSELVAIVDDRDLDWVQSTTDCEQAPRLAELANGYNVTEIGTNLRSVMSPWSAAWDEYDRIVEREGGRLLWSGDFPGARACRALGFFCRPGDNGRDVPCDADDPASYLDLNRLWGATSWDRVKRQFCYKGQYADP